MRDDEQLRNVLNGCQFVYPFIDKETKNVGNLLRLPSLLYKYKLIDGQKWERYVLLQLLLLFVRQFANKLHCIRFPQSSLDTLFDISHFFIASP